jgi:predicted MFS family arabinose efflux permease
VAGLAIAAIAIAALTYAAFPIFPVVLAAAVLHAAASCVLGPAIAAISLGLVGHAAVGERLGRNARFQSIGSGLAAGAMGACGYFFSARAVFIVTALLLVPTLLALRRIAPSEINPERAHGGSPPPAKKRSPAEYLSLLRNRPLLIFAGCIMLFHLANAAMLPLMATVLTTQSSEWATLLIAMCIIVPQCVIGVMVPLIIADVTRGTGHFNLGQGLVGTMTGLGAAASATLAGYMTQYLNSQIAFLGLAGVGVTAVLVAWALMPETRPEPEQEKEQGIEPDHDTSAAAGPDRPPSDR